MIGRWAWVTAIVLLLLQGCASRSARVFLVIGPEVPEPAEPVRRGSAAGPEAAPFATVRFLGFTHLKPEETAIRGKIRPAATSRGASGETASAELDVILEGERSGRSGGVTLLNLIGSLLTATIIPFRNSVNYRVTYRVAYFGATARECVFTVLTNEWVGVLLLPLSPFVWPRRARVAALERTATAFARGCALEP